MSTATFPLGMHPYFNIKGGGYKSWKVDPNINLNKEDGNINLDGVKGIGEPNNPITSAAPLGLSAVFSKNELIDPGSYLKNSKNWYPKSRPLKIYRRQYSTSNTKSKVSCSSFDIPGGNIFRINPIFYEKNEIDGKYKTDGNKNPILKNCNTQENKSIPGTTIVSDYKTKKNITDTCTYKGTGEEVLCLARNAKIKVQGGTTLKSFLYNQCDNYHSSSSDFLFSRGKSFIQLENPLPPCGQAKTILDCRHNQEILSKNCAKCLASCGIDANYNPERPANISYKYPTAYLSRKVYPCGRFNRLHLSTTTHSLCDDTIAVNTVFKPSNRSFTTNTAVPNSYLVNKKKYTSIIRSTEKKNNIWNPSLISKLTNGENPGDCFMLKEKAENCNSVFNQPRRTTKYTCAQPNTAEKKSWHKKHTIVIQEAFEFKFTMKTVGSIDYTYDGATLLESYYDDFKSDFKRSQILTLDVDNYNFDIKNASHGSLVPNVNHTRDIHHFPYTISEYTTYFFASKTGITDSNASHAFQSNGFPKYMTKFSTTSTNNSVQQEFYYIQFPKDLRNNTIGENYNQYVKPVFTQLTQLPSQIFSKTLSTTVEAVKPGRPPKYKYYTNCTITTTPINITQDNTFNVEKTLWTSRKLSMNNYYGIIGCMLNGCWFAGNIGSYNKVTAVFNLFHTDSRAPIFTVVDSNPPTIKEKDSQPIAYYLNTDLNLYYSTSSYLNPFHFTQITTSDEIENIFDLNPISKQWNNNYEIQTKEIIIRPNFTTDVPENMTLLHAIILNGKIQTTSNISDINKPYYIFLFKINTNTNVPPIKTTIHIHYSDSSYIKYVNLSIQFYTYKLDFVNQYQSFGSILEPIQDTSPTKFDFFTLDDPNDDSSITNQTSLIDITNASINSDTNEYIYISLNLLDTVPSNNSFISNGDPFNGYYKIVVKNMNDNHEITIMPKQGGGNHFADIYLLKDVTMTGLKSPCSDKTPLWTSGQYPLPEKVGYKNILDRNQIFDLSSDVNRDIFTNFLTTNQTHQNNISNYLSLQNSVPGSNLSRPANGWPAHWNERAVGDHVNWINSGTNLWISAHYKMTLNGSKNQLELDITLYPNTGADDINTHRDNMANNRCWKCESDQVGIMGDKDSRPWSAVDADTGGKYHALNNGGAIGIETRTNVVAWGGFNGSLGPVTNPLTGKPSWVNQTGYLIQFKNLLKFTHDGIKRLQSNPRAGWIIDSNLPNTGIINSLDWDTTQGYLKQIDQWSPTVMPGLLLKDDSLPKRNPDNNIPMQDEQGPKYGTTNPYSSTVMWVIDGYKYPTTQPSQIMPRPLSEQYLPAVKYITFKLGNYTIKFTINQNYSTIGMGEVWSPGNWYMNGANARARRYWPLFNNGVNFNSTQVEVSYSLKESVPGRNVQNPNSSCLPYIYISDFSNLESFFEYTNSPELINCGTSNKHSLFNGDTLNHANRWSDHSEFTITTGDKDTCNNLTAYKPGVLFADSKEQGKQGESADVLLLTNGQYGSLRQPPLPFSTTGPSYGGWAQNLIDHNMYSPPQDGAYIKIFIRYKNTNLVCLQLKYLQFVLGDNNTPSRHYFTWDTRNAHTAESINQQYKIDTYYLGAPPFTNAKKEPHDSNYFDNYLPSIYKDTTYCNVKLQHIISDDVYNVIDFSVSKTPNS